MNAPVKFYQTDTFTVGNRLLAPKPARDPARDRPMYPSDEEPT